MFLLPGYPAQTIDSLVINGYVGQPVSIIWVDEALLGHPGVIELIRRKLTPVQMRCSGDPLQLPYYPQTNSWRVSGKKFPWSNVVSYEVSWRNPKAIVDLLKPVYEAVGRAFIQGNNRLGRCKVVYIPGPSAVPRGHDIYMTYRKDENISMGVHHKDMIVNTIH